MKEPQNGDRYVTWRDLGDKLDEIKDEQSEQGKEIARIGATLALWLKLGPVLIAVAVAFGPEVAKAFS